MRILLLCFFCYLWLSCPAQVRDVKSNVEKDKSGHSSASNPPEMGSTAFSSPDVSDGLGSFIVESIFNYTVYGIYSGFEYGQSLMQYHRQEYPETFALEGDIFAGFAPSADGRLTGTALRGNWGLFASDLRFLNTDDVTGSMNIVDWQVLMFRLPVKNSKLEYGIGFSHFFLPSKSYFEQSVGFDWCFLKRKVTLQGQYRWSQFTSLGNRYRQEASITGDYEIGRAGAFAFCPSAGFTFQNYFDSTRFRFFTIGLKVRLFY